MISKAVKNYKEKAEECWLLSKIADKYYNIKYAILRPFKHLRKMYQWYKNVFRYDYDFDANNLTGIIAYKLKRTQKTMINGHCHHESDTLKSIRIAIKLADRLYADEYDLKARNRHTKVWGEQEYWFTPIEDGKYFICHSRWPKAIFEKQKKLCHNQYKSGYESAEKCKDRDIRNLFRIIDKYLRTWWD